MKLGGKLIKGGKDIEVKEKERGNVGNEEEGNGEELCKVGREERKKERIDIDVKVEEGEKEEIKRVIIERMVGKKKN